MEKEILTNEEKIIHKFCDENIKFFNSKNTKHIADITSDMLAEDIYDDIYKDYNNSLEEECVKIKDKLLRQTIKRKVAQVPNMDKFCLNLAKLLSVEIQSTTTEALMQLFQDYRIDTKHSLQNKIENNARTKLKEIAQTKLNKAKLTKAEKKYSRNKGLKWKNQ